MDYQKHYILIIENRKANPLPKDVYGERHHIIPLSEGGPNRTWNIVKLNAKEHYVCHKLLVKIYNDKKMKYALKMMMTCKNKKVKRDFRVNSRLFEELKKEFGEMMSGEGNPMYGVESPMKGKHLTLEQRQKLSNALKGKYVGVNNKNFGKKRPQSVVEAVRKANTGRKRSLESRQKQSMSTRGEKHRNWGKHLPDTTRLNIQQSSKYRMKPVLVFKDGVLIDECDGINIAATKYDVFRGNLQKVLRGDITQTGGYVFKYKNAV